MEDDKLFEAAANAAFDDDDADDRFEAELVITDDGFNAELEEAEKKVFFFLNETYSVPNCDCFVWL